MTTTGPDGEALRRLAPSELLKTLVELTEAALATEPTLACGERLVEERAPVVAELGRQIAASGPIATPENVALLGRLKELDLELLGRVGSPIRSHIDAHRTKATQSPSTEEQVGAAPIGFSQTPYGSNQPHRRALGRI